MLADHYETMTRYVAYLGSKARDHIVAHGLGDWYDIGPRDPGPSQLTSFGLTATAIYYGDLMIVAETARRLKPGRRAVDLGGADLLSGPARAGVAPLGACLLAGRLAPQAALMHIRAMRRIHQPDHAVIESAGEHL